MTHDRLFSTLTVPHVVSANAIVGHCGIEERSRQYPGLALMRPVAPDEPRQSLHEHHGNCHHNRHEHDHNCKMQGPADHMPKQGKARALRHQIHAALCALAGAWLTNIGVHRTKIDVRHVHSLIQRTTLRTLRDFPGTTVDPHQGALPGARQIGDHPGRKAGMKGEHHVVESLLMVWRILANALDVFRAGYDDPLGGDVRCDSVVHCARRDNSSKPRGRGCDWNHVVLRNGAWSFA
jgi:hypothetical protein